MTVEAEISDRRQIGPFRFRWPDAYEDFDSVWEFLLTVLPASAGVASPRCTAGRGDAPAEDSGGIWAFNAERARRDGPDGSFDPAGVTEALASLAGVITPG